MNRVGKKTASTEYNKKVTIQSRTKTSDGEGGFVLSWANVSTPWAAVFPISAKQVFEYRSINVDATHVIKLRGGVSISETNRIVFRSRNFEVLTAENMQERGVETIVTCKEDR